MRSMFTRRHALRLFGSASAAAMVASRSGAASVFAGLRGDTVGEARPLAPGTPNSPERTALIDVFRKQSEGLDKKFEPNTLESAGSTMPYRLFRPEAAAKLPLVVYLHGSGGVGDDNLNQPSLDNISGPRVWLPPKNQNRFPCFVPAPQPADGGVRYALSQETQGPAPAPPGLGNGARLAFEIIDRLSR